MLVSYAGAGKETAAITDALSASHALVCGSEYFKNHQISQASFQPKRGSDVDRRTFATIHSTVEVPLHLKARDSDSLSERVRSIFPRKEARHLFWSRRADIGSADDSASQPVTDNGPYACAPTDSGEHSLTLVSTAGSAETGSTASSDRAPAASGRVSAAADDIMIHGQEGSLSLRTMVLKPASISARPRACVLQSTRNIHDVANLVAQLSVSEPIYVFSFRASSDAAPARRIKLQSCWPASWRNKLIGLPACPQHISKAEAANITHAAVLPRGGATISNVTLDLGFAGILVLQGTSRTELHNVVVEGGVLLCHGPQCHLTLTDCTLKGCKLIIAEGATADIQRTHIREHFFTNAAACVTSGRGTTVHATDTHVCVGRGFVVQDRARLTGAGMHFTGMNGVLLTAAGPGTEATLERSTFEFLRNKSVPAVAASLRVLFRGCAVESRDGAAVALSGCELKAFRRGVHAVRHGRVHLEGCVAETSRDDGTGVFAQMGNVTMKATRVVGCGEHGVCVGGGGPTMRAHVMAEGCTIEGTCQPVSVQTDEWSSAEMRDCELNGQAVSAAWWSHMWNAVLTK